MLFHEWSIWLNVFLYFWLFSDLYSELMINRRAFPTSKDFIGSLNAILRIQEVYNLSARALADGDLHQTIPSGGLGADECYELGIGSNDQENYEGVTGWMKEALKRMSPPYEYSGALTKIDVLEYLAWAEYKVSWIKVVPLLSWFNALASSSGIFLEVSHFTFFIWLV